MKAHVDAQPTIPVSPLRQNAKEGHQILVVLNESRLLDTKGANGEWISKHVGARNSTPKGIYDLTGAEKPARNLPSKSYEGNVLHVSNSHVYQVYAGDKGQTAVVKHDRALFRDGVNEKIPAVGARLTMNYDRGQGRVVSQERDKSIGR